MGLGFGKNLTSRKVSFTLSSLLYDFSKYDIVHTLAPIMYAPPRRGKAKIVTSLQELVMVDKNSAYAMVEECWFCDKCS